jgi:hypothetical protein
MRSNQHEKHLETSHFTNQVAGDLSSRQQHTRVLGSTCQRYRFRLVALSTGLILLKGPFWQEQSRQQILATGRTVVISPVTSQLAHTTSAAP